ncbi:endoplasmic reticulum junction formation protein lunapark-B [Danaus plexippus]|uniref:endoplasmic reticulum junction formation protein lunapark-B n=1 Tax=Danaus plexippus TaxID=13037 RepID=UPI002AB2BCBD|nr:endoplasmic reticulum junction formation protein lunapark-B [Danaus plexippus]
MGLIISRFWIKKTKVEVLDTLDTKIKKLEQDSRNKELAHQRLVGQMMASSIGLYVIIAIVYYYKYVGSSQHWLDSLLYASPLLLLPMLVIFLRASLSRYFDWTITRNRSKLIRLRDEKKKILESVMTTETYKVAKEILDKYGTPEEQSKSLVSQKMLSISNKASSATPATPVHMRQRQLVLPTPRSLNSSHLETDNPGQQSPLLRSDQLPRPIPPRNPTLFDKVVDYLLKDGPEHRMALICSRCSSHNGMALIEEFDFFSYKCAYCGNMNLARKQRPIAPPLMPRPGTTAANLPARTTRAVIPFKMDTDNNTCSSDESSDAEPVRTGEDEDDRHTNGETNRSPSPAEGERKSEEEKKED